MLTVILARICGHLWTYVVRNFKFIQSYFPQYFVVIVVIAVVVVVVVIIVVVVVVALFNSKIGSHT